MKTVRFQLDAERLIMSGVNTAARLAETVIGPGGRSTIVERPHASPLSVAGGYEICLALTLGDRGAQAGVQMLREMTWRVRDAVGDGTATSVILARSMAHWLLRGKAAGFAAADLSSSFRRQSTTLLESLSTMGKPVEDSADVVRVACFAARGDLQIAERTASIYAEVGQAGFIETRTSERLEDNITLHRGVSFPAKLALLEFSHGLNDFKIENPIIIVNNGTIQDLRPIVRILEMMAKAGRSLLIAASGFEGEALSTLLQNRQHNGLTIMPVVPTDIGRWRELALQDLSLLTGSALIDPSVGLCLTSLRPEMVGNAVDVCFARGNLSIRGGKGDPKHIANRVNEIHMQIAKERDLSFDCEQHRRRLARFGAGMVTWDVGGRSEQEIDMKLALIKKTVAAVWQAGQGGIAPGGGLGLIAAHEVARVGSIRTEADKFVDHALSKIVHRPLEAMARNAGRDVDHFLECLNAEHHAKDLVRIGARKKPVVYADPAAVLSTAFRCASSCAASIINLGAIVCEKGPEGYQH